MHPNRRTPTCRFVYFFQAENGGPIKIGRATDVAQRLSDCQVGNPSQLVVRHIIEVDDATDMEHRLHILFANHRLRGEWFECCPALAALVGVEPDPSIESDAVAYPDRPKDHDQAGRYDDWGKNTTEARTERAANIRAREQRRTERRDLVKARIAAGDLELEATTWSTAPALTAMPEDWDWERAARGY